MRVLRGDEGLVEADPGVRSVRRAVGILKLLASARAGWRLSDVARRCGLGKTTTHRLLGALADEGLVIQEAGSRRYALGHELVRLGRAAGRADVTDLARPALLRLARETEDTVFVSVREGLEAVCLDRAIGDYPIKTLTLNVGDRRPLGVGAGSLALLAQLPDAEVEEIVAGSATALARYPGFAPTALRELVGRTRQQGYAFNDGRVIPAMSAVGVPVFDAVGQVCAALSVAAIAERMRAPRVRWIAERLQAEAARLGQDIAAPSQTAKLEEMPA